MKLEFIELYKDELFLKWVLLTNYLELELSRHNFNAKLENLSKEESRKIYAQIKQELNLLDKIENLSDKDSKSFINETFDYYKHLISKATIFN